MEKGTPVRSEPDGSDNNILRGCFNAPKQAAAELTSSLSACQFQDDMSSSKHKFCTHHKKVDLHAKSITTSLVCN